MAADEFVILLPAIESEVAVVRVAEKLLSVTRLPFALQEREVYLTASLGISRYPEDGTDAETLLKRAEIAMYRTKETSRDGYQIYVPGMDSHSLEQLSLEADLRRELASGGSPSSISRCSTPAGAPSRGSRPCCAGTTPRAA